MADKSTNTITHAQYWPILYHFCEAQIALGAMSGRRNEKCLSTLSFLHNQKECVMVPVVDWHVFFWNVVDVMASGKVSAFALGLAKQLCVQ